MPFTPIGPQYCCQDCQTPGTLQTFGGYKLGICKNIAILLHHRHTTEKREDQILSGYLFNIQVLLAQPCQLPSDAGPDRSRATQAQSFRSLCVLLKTWWMSFWQPSQVKTNIFRDNMMEFCTERGVKLGVARRFVGEIALWAISRNKAGENSVG